MVSEGFKENAVNDSVERLRSLAAERKAQMAEMDQSLDEILGEAPTTPTNPHGESDEN
jgi:hypothetical protein